MLRRESPLASSPLHKMTLTRRLVLPLMLTRRLLLPPGARPSRPSDDRSDDLPCDDLPRSTLRDLCGDTAPTSEPKRTPPHNLRRDESMDVDSVLALGTAGPAAPTTLSGLPLPPGDLVVVDVL